MSILCCMGGGALLGTSSLPPWLRAEQGQPSLCSRMESPFVPSLVLLPAGLGFGLLADARKPPGAGWLVVFEDGQEQPR